MSDLPGTRDGVERPQRPARHRIERTRVSGRSKRHFVHTGADDDDVLVDGRRSGVADDHVDFAVGAESFGGLAGRRVEGQQVAARGDEHARRRRTVAGPVTDAATRHRSRRWSAADLARPDRFARIRLEGDDGGAGGEIHDARDDERHGFRAAETEGADAPAWRRRKVERPRLRQPRDVAGVDLHQRGEAGSREIVVIGAPFLRRRRGGPLRTSGYDQSKNRERGDEAAERGGTLASRRRGSANGDSVCAHNFGSANTIY